MHHQEGARGGEDRQVGDGDPDDIGQRRPVGRHDRRRPGQAQQHRPGDNGAKGEHHHRLAPVQAAHQWRVEGMGGAAEQEHDLAEAKVEGQDAVDIGPEDHPDCPGTGNGKADGNARSRHLAQQEPAENRAHQRGQGENGGGRDRVGQTQRHEHQEEVDGELKIAEMEN